MDLPRSCAYYQSVPVIPSQEEITIKNAIDQIHYREPSYGVRRVLQELNKLGFTKLGRRRVRRYMREMDIIAFYPGPNLSKRAKQSKLYPYLLRKLAITRLNQVWSIDITYIGTPTGFAYMTAIIDWHSRFIVGYSISNSLETDSLIRTLKSAVEIYGPPDIINSDQGAQFTSIKYTQYIQSLGSTRISMNGKGRATDNIAIERFFRSYKWERMYLMYPETIAEVKEITKEYMQTYNFSRGHQSLDYKTPAEIYFEKSSQQVA